MNGYISSLGLQYGIPTPINDSLVDMVVFRTDIAIRASHKLGGAAYDSEVPCRAISSKYGMVYKPITVRKPELNFRQKRERRSSIP